MANMSGCSLHKQPGLVLDSDLGNGVDARGDHRRSAGIGPGYAGVSSSRLAQAERLALQSDDVAVMEQVVEDRLREQRPQPRCVGAVGSARQVAVAPARRPEVAPARVGCRVGVRLRGDPAIRHNPLHGAPRRRSNN
jgi:hypothetical protein